MKGLRSFNGAFVKPRRTAPSNRAVMKTYALLGVALVGVATAFTPSAKADVAISISLGFPVLEPRVIVAPRVPPPPPPVVVACPPVVVRPPVHVIPRPVVSCAPVIVSRPVFIPPGHARRFERGHGHHPGNGNGRGHGRFHRH